MSKLLVTALVAAAASASALTPSSPPPPRPQQRLGAASRGPHLHVVSDGRVGSIWDWVSNHGRRTTAATPATTLPPQGHHDPPSYAS